MNRISKLLYSLAAATLSIAVLGAHHTGQLYPVFPTGILFATVFILATVYLNNSASLIQLVPIVGLSLFYRGFVFTFPAITLGADTDGYAVDIVNMLREGTTNAIGGGFYYEAPIFFIFHGVGSQITGISLPSAFILVPLTLGSCIPLFAALYAREILGRVRTNAALIAALIAAIATMGVILSYIPIPQSLSVIYWGMLIYLFARSFQLRSRRILLLETILLIAMIHIHKLPVLAAELSILVFIALTLLILGCDRFRGIPSQRRQHLQIAIPLALIIGVFVAVQWIYISNFIIIISQKLSLFLLVTSEQASSSIGGPPTAAVSTTPGFLPFLRNRIHAFAILSLSGIAWAYWFLRQRTAPVIALLAPSTALVLLMTVGVVNRNLIPYYRLLFFGEAIFAALIATALFNQCGSRRIRVGKALILVLLLISQIGASAAMPDTPDRLRIYLTQSEVDAKQFGNGHIEDVVHTDYYYSTTVIPSAYQDGGSATYKNFNGLILNGTLVDRQPAIIAYRHQKTAYTATGGKYLPRRSPEMALEARYNAVYGNGAVTYFHSNSSVSISNGSDE